MATNIIMNMNKTLKFIVFGFLSVMLLVGCKKEFVIPEPFPGGELKGEFSVGDSNKVIFSKGNLQYQASTNTWRFAESQLGVVGLDNKQISETDTCWIDLFGWATSGFPHGSACYQPWSSSDNGRSYYAYEMFQTYSLFDKTGQADWGYNAISNGGNEQNIWRTPRYEEWNYLLKERETKSGLRFIKAEIDELNCKTNGLVIFPDNWNSTLYKVNKPNDAESMYGDNVISLGDWFLIFEFNGCVFLPAAGSRSSQIVRNCNVAGKYWSSTCAGIYCAGTLSFDYLYFGTYLSEPCSSGYSVRLVKDKK